MELQSFIQSGLLESYALGQGTAEERSLVERMFNQHAEVRTELAAIEQAMESYAKALGTPPPAWMKGRILDQIAQIPASTAPVGTPVPIASSLTTLRMFQLATVVLLLTGAFFWNRNSQLRNENTIQQAHYNQLRSENTTQQAQLADCTKRSGSKEQLYALLKHTATKIVKLQSASPDQEASTMVYYNPRLGTILNTASVVQPSGQHTYYQFWAIVGGKPVSMGMVQMDATDGWQKMPEMANAEAFAISAENNPAGNRTPTTVVMIGKLSG